MKKFIYALVCSLAMQSGPVLARDETKKEMSKKPTTIIDKKATAEARKKWDASPDGIAFNKWKASPDGKKVLADGAKVRANIKGSTDIEAVVTALGVPPTAGGHPAGIKGILIAINGVEYILDLHSGKELKQLNILKLNDRITIKSRGGSYALKYPYYILSAEQIQQNGKLFYKRVLPKGGC